MFKRIKYAFCRLFGIGEYQSFNDYLCKSEISANRQGCNIVSSTSEDHYRRDIFEATTYYKYGYLSKTDYKKLKIEIDHRYAKISDVEFEYKTKAIDYDDGRCDEDKFRLIELDYKLEKKLISQEDYERSRVEIMYADEVDIVGKEKAIANINKDPWCHMDLVYNKENNDLELTFDYNEYYIEMLRERGFSGSDDDVIDSYISQWSKSLQHGEVVESE